MDETDILARLLALEAKYDTHMAQFEEFKACNVAFREETKQEIKASTKKNSHNATSREQKEKHETKSENARDLQAKDSVNAESVKEKTETTIPKQIGSVVWAVSALTSLIIVLLIVFGVIVYKLKK